jgi:hypothetical protein
MIRSRSVSEAAFTKSSISGELSILYFRKINLMFIELDFNRDSRTVKRRVDEAHCRCVRKIEIIRTDSVIILA